MEWWQGVLLVLAAAGAMLGGLTLLRPRLAPEASRKIAHVGTGLLALTFPHLFDAAWPVVGMVAVVSLALLAVRQLPVLRRTVGATLHDVDRRSLGEFYLLGSIAFLFAITGGGLLYTVPVLIVTFADATAALVGVSYGRHRYDATEGTKSAEGSIAFFVVAFFATHVPLLLGSDVGRAESLLLGLILGFLLLLFEGTAWRGLDNLFIPLSAYALLDALVDEPARQLALVVGVVAAMALFALLWRRRTTLNAGALFGAVLVGFLFWALGGWAWLLAPVIVFAGYTWLPPRVDLDRMRIHTVHVVLSVTGTGIAWLFLARVLDDPARLFLPFNAAFAAHLAIIELVRLRYARPQMPPLRAATASVAVGALLILAPYAILTRDLVGAAVGVVAVAGAAGLFHAIHYRRLLLPDPELRWRRQAASAALASAATLLVVLV